MRLLSLTVRNYRVHQDLTVAFDCSRTLIGGPNESGKSTLAEAAHRALFLRAKTGGKLHEEMRSSLHKGDPEVVLAFEASGTRWTIEKRFAGAKGSALLTDASGHVYKDDEAETKLSELHQCETNGGRVAAGQLPGLWSHLWVWQGRAGDAPSSHTAEQKDNLVRHLQQSSVSAVLQSATDQRVASRIAEAYVELFTATGRPKAGSKPELARVRLEEAEAALQKATEAATRLTEAADDHARAERDIAEIAPLLPKLCEDRASTEAWLQQAAMLRRDEEIHRQAVAAATARRVELETHDRALRELQSKHTAQSAALQPADEQLAALAAAEENARVACQDAEATLREAAESLRRARMQHDLASAAVAACEKTEVHQRLAERAKEAEGIQEELAAFRSALAKLPVLDAKDLARLRKLENETGQASAALDAMATGVELIASPVPVHLDGKPLAAGQPRILTETGELLVGEGARLRIRPGGGTSLAAARARVQAARDALVSALQAHALPDSEHAAAALEQRQSLGQKITSLEARWKALGGVSLATELAQATADLQAAREEWKRRRELAATAGITAVDADLKTARERVGSTRDALASAETADTTARQQAGRLREKLEAATAALAHHRGETSAARQTLRDLETSIKTREETHGSEAARVQAIAVAREAETQAAGKLAATHEALAALNPDLLAADRDRFARALATQESRLREAENIRLLARDRLTLDGSTDPEAELCHALARCEAARAEYASEERRAKAIEKLHHLFTTSREATDRALVQPLAGRISGYLQCLFGPGAEARVQLSDSGIEGLELIRPGTPAFSFDTLSGGAKEQAAAAVRLALAEILAADHDGCLPIVFDDAFAYSDPERIQSLQRMLDLAATRGLQVIVLTCTPADYSAFGAGEIRLGSA